MLGLQAAPRVAREPDVLKALVGTRVLVVDDNPDARALLEAVLTYCGAFVSTAATPRAAVAQFRERPVDVVVATIGHAGEEGDRLVREIGARAPVVAMTSGPAHDAERVLAAGFHGHLRKPVDPWELCRMVAGLARKP